MCGAKNRLTPHLFGNPLHARVSEDMRKGVREEVYRDATTSTQNNNDNHINISGKGTNLSVPSQDRIHKMVIQSERSFLYLRIKGKRHGEPLLCSGSFSN